MLSHKQKTEISSVLMLLALVGAVLWIVKNSQSLFTLLILAVISLVIAVKRGFQIHRQKNPLTIVKREDLENLDPKKLKPWMTSQLLGHDTAIDEILRVIDRNITLFKSEKLLAKFLLAGPTGTGKTYLAEVLSQGLYGKDSFLFIPMGQFQQAHDIETVFQLITEKLNQQEHFVLLLDEIDRCHSGVRESLLHYLDVGQIIMPESGEKIQTPGIIVVATTNAGEGLLEQMSVHEALKETGKFDTAFLARFDGIYAFKKLKDIDIAQVTIKYLKRYYSNHGIEVTFMEPEVLLDMIKANKEFEMYGLRHLLKVIQTKSDQILYAAKKKNIQQLRLAVKDGEIVAVTKKKAAS